MHTCASSAELKGQRTSTRLSPTRFMPSSCKSQSPIGRCRTFCPELETERRKKQKALHVLEIKSQSDEGKDVQMVKEYVRAGAGQSVPDPSFLRPLDVLTQVMHYLITNILDRTDYPWHVIYEFVTDRIQAIRQDITFQQLTGPDVTCIFQLASRFHIYAQHRLWGYPLNKFDLKLNGDHLQHCLVKVIRNEHCPAVVSTRTAEFEAYYILSNLGNGEVLNRTFSLSADMRSDTLVKSSIAVSLQFMSNNFVRCCRLISKLPPLHRAAVIPHVQQIRRRAIQTLSTAYSSKNAKFPIELLCSWILIENVQEGIELCNAHGIVVEENFIIFRKGSYKLSDQMSKGSIKILELSDYQPSNFILKSTNLQ